MGDCRWPWTGADHRRSLEGVSCSTRRCRRPKEWAIPFDKRRRRPYFKYDPARPGSSWNEPACRKDTRPRSTNTPTGPRSSSNDQLVSKLKDVARASSTPRVGLHSHDLIRQYESMAFGPQTQFPEPALPLRAVLPRETKNHGHINAGARRLAGATAAHSGRGQAERGDPASRHLSPPQYKCRYRPACTAGGKERSRNYGPIRLSLRRAADGG